MPNPVVTNTVNATQAQLNQAAANIALNLYNEVKNGASTISPENAILDLCVAVMYLVGYNANTSDWTTSLPTHYSSNVSTSGVKIAPRMK